MWPNRAAAERSTLCVSTPRSTFLSKQVVPRSRGGSGRPATAAQKCAELISCGGHQILGSQSKYDVEVML